MYRLTLRNRKKGIVHKAEFQTLKELIDFMQEYDLNTFEIFVTKDV